MMKRMTLLLAAAALAALIGCSSEDDDGGADDGASPTATIESVPTDSPASAASPTDPADVEAATECEDATAVAVAIAEGLTVTGGGMLRDAQAVRSGDFSSVYFIAAEIDGPGIDGDGQIGVWASNSLTPGMGLIYSVNAVANEFSDWGDGGATDAEFSASDDGAEEAVVCVAG